MSIQAVSICDVKIGDAWEAVTLAEAHAKHRLADKRCPTCHGRVIVVGTYGWPPKLNISHRKSHQGCPISTKTFRGEAWPHPEALA